MTYSAENVQPNQETLSLGTLYLCSATHLGQPSEVDYRWQGNRSIWINSGTVNIYVSNSATQPTALSSMTLSTDDTGVSGIGALDVIPRWIAIVQASGTSTEIVLTGVDVESKGAIS